MSADTPPVRLDQRNRYADAFGRLQELVRQFLAGEISREYMAERHAAITAAARDDVTTAETGHGCDTNGGHYDWCQGADPELEDGATELPGESRKGDTAGRVSAHRLDRMGTVVVGTLLPYDESEGERVRDDAGVVWAVEADSVRPANWNREDRNGDTAATDLPRWRVTHDPNTDGSSFVGDLYRYNGARWEGQANDGTWVQSAYGGVDDMRRWGYGLSEVPPAQSGEATA